MDNFADLVRLTITVQLSFPHYFMRTGIVPLSVFFRGEGTLLFGLSVAFIYNINVGRIVD